MLIEGAIVVQDIDELKFVTYSNFIIIGVVGRSDFDGTRSKLNVDDLIADNRHSAVDERMYRIFAIKMLKDER